MCDLFNSCLIHNYVPKCMVAGVIRPCIKNKFGNVLDSNNYREIMISSNVYKVFENCLLPFFSSHLQISSHQFAYRPDTSTILATSLLKENISKFLFDGSVVYSCFLDLSRAFEKVDHNILLDKLLQTSLPICFSNILEQIFKKTSVSVNYCNAHSAT